MYVVKMNVTEEETSRFTRFLVAYILQEWKLSKQTISCNCLSSGAYTHTQQQLYTPNNAIISHLDLASHIAGH